MTDLIDKNELLKKAVMISGPSGKSTYSVVFTDDITNTKAIESYTKADMVAMLEDLKKEIVEITISKATVLGEIFWNMGADAMQGEIGTRIQEKIDSLKENTDE